MEFGEFSSESSFCAITLGLRVFKCNPTFRGEGDLMLEYIEADLDDFGLPVAVTWLSYAGATMKFDPCFY